jgi:hypothetical protein
VLKIPKIHNWTIDTKNNSLNFNIDIKVDGYMHVPNGNKTYIGTAEYYNGTIKAILGLKNMNLSGRLNGSTPGYVPNFETAFIETAYGIGRYESTPYPVNIVVFGALTVINNRMLRKGMILPSNFSSISMELKDAYLGYFSDYLLLGLTPYFSKAKPSTPTNKNLTSELPPMIANVYGNKTNVVELDKAVDYFADRFLNKLINKLEENDLLRREVEDADFAEFERKRDVSCDDGRCEYITRIIDELEGISPKIEL